MADPSDSSLAFFSKATPKQWRFVYELRRDAINLKADQRSSKKGGPEELIKLDTWFREKIPQLIHSRKDPHVLYEELVQIAKWRLMMGKYRPKMLDLVRINTESSVVKITRNAFKKLQHKNLQQAIQQLVNLKGIGPSTASAILAAAYPEEAPFMSDEGMLSTPGVEATDSTIAEYNNYSEQLRNKAESLRKSDPDYKWSPHKVDQVLWIYYLIRDMKPTLLDSMPRGDDNSLPSSTNNNTNTNNQLSDAVDDNANSMPPININNCSTSSNRSQSSSSVILGDEESSSQDVLINHESSLNGTFNEDDSESASVPFSEEDLSQGAASCSVDSTAATIGSDISTVTGIIANNNTINNINNTNNNNNVVSSMNNSNNTNNNPISYQLNGMGSTPINGNGNGLPQTTVVLGDDSNLSVGDVADDESSSNGMMPSQRLLMINNNNTNDTSSLPSTTTGGGGRSINVLEPILPPSAENSVDDVVSSGVVEEEEELEEEESLDEAPPMKKQKTGLELSQALAAATAETAGAEA